MRLSQLHWNEIEKDVASMIWASLGTAVHNGIEKANKGNVVTYGDWKSNKLKEILDFANSEERRIYVDNEASTNGLRRVYEMVLDKINSALLQEKEDISIKDKQTENRLYSSIMGIKISGQQDLYKVSESKLSDYKTTKVYKAMKPIEENFDWEAQLNIYVWLLRENGEDPKVAEIIAIMRDWSPTEAKKKEDYPPTPIKVIQFPIWSYQKQTEFILNRIVLLGEASKVMHEDELYKKYPCSADDKWQVPTTYRVMKKGGKRAVTGGAFGKDKEGAYAFLKTKDDNHYVDVKIGYNRRCEEYCDVKNFCVQRKTELKMLNKATSVSVDTNIEIPEELPETKEAEEVPMEKSATISIAERLLRNKSKVSSNEKKIRSTKEVIAEMEQKVIDARKVIVERYKENPPPKPIEITSKPAPPEPEIEEPTFEEPNKDDSLDYLLDDLEGLL
jgi:hypothetical protein